MKPIFRKVYGPEETVEVRYVPFTAFQTDRQNAMFDAVRLMEIASRASGDMQRRIEQSCYEVLEGCVAPTEREMIAALDRPPELQGKRELVFVPRDRTAAFTQRLVGNEIPSCRHCGGSPRKRFGREWALLPLLGHESE